MKNIETSETENSKQAIRNDPFYYRIQNTNHDWQLSNTEHTV